MKPPPFEYSRPSSLAEAVALLAEAGDEAKLLAGGQSFIPLLNFRLASPRLVVDLNRIAELSYIAEGGGRLKLGAMARTREVETSEVVRRTIPLLSHAAGWIGHVQIRNRGTVGGSVAHADPAAELPALCVLLDAELTVRGPAGERVCPASRFFHGLMSTELSADEILTEVSIPIPPAQARWGFREFAQRRGDFAVAGAACTLTPAADGSLGDARLVVFGATGAPVRCVTAEHALRGRELDSSALDGIPAMVRGDLAQGDGGVRGAYEGEVAEVMLRRALEEATRPGRG